jgi:hypothetical protein
MFKDCTFSHHHYQSACQRFAESHNLSAVARTIGMKPQTLANKCNPEQPHELTVSELIAIYHATHDETLLDGMLLECGLSAVEITGIERMPSLMHQAIDLNAKIASIGQQALELSERGRITSTERHTLVGIGQYVIGATALFIQQVEARFQAVPVLSCATDMLMSGSMPGLS